MTPGWRPALRIARRDALRNRGRTALILLMVLLPVTAVAAGQLGTGYIVDIPWLMLTALLVLVPLVAAGAAAATRRQPSPSRPA